MKNGKLKVTGSLASIIQSISTDENGIIHIVWKTKDAPKVRWRLYGDEISAYDDRWNHMVVIEKPEAWNIERPIGRFNRFQKYSFDDRSYDHRFSSSEIIHYRAQNESIILFNYLLPQTALLYNDYNKMGYASRYIEMVSQNKIGFEVLFKEHTPNTKFTWQINPNQSRTIVEGLDDKKKMAIQIQLSRKLTGKTIKGFVGPITYPNMQNIFLLVA